MRDLYSPKITKGFETCIYGIFLPKNTVYMRTEKGYVWASAYDVKNRKNGLNIFVLGINDKFPHKKYVSTECKTIVTFTKYIVENNIECEKPIQVVNKHTMNGLSPKNIMVSKAYKGCAVYAVKEAKEVKTKKSIEWRM